jgi:SnoaL-like protein
MSMPVMLSVEDRLDIHELLALHGHLMDAGAFERLDELFTPDFVYDVSLLGGGELVGAAALQEAALALGDANPIGHHVTNVIVRPGSEPDRAMVSSKGIGVNADGTTGHTDRRGLADQPSTGGAQAASAPSLSANDNGKESQLPATFNV